MDESRASLKRAGAGSGTGRTSPSPPKRKGTSRKLPLPPGYKKGGRATKAKGGKAKR